MLVCGGRCDQRRLATLSDIERNAVLCYGTQKIELDIFSNYGPVGDRVEFDVADVAFPVISMGKMVDSGFRFVIDAPDCWMVKGDRWVNVYRKGRTFVLRLKCKEQTPLKPMYIAPMEDMMMPFDQDREDAAAAVRADAKLYL